MEIFTVIRANDGTNWYNQKGKLHNPYGPAVLCLDGYRAYYVNGLRHREDGPAIVYSNGNKQYFINGKELTEEEFNNRNKRSIVIDGKTIYISNESFEELKKQLT